jgi:hypothetical protein
MSRSSQPVAVSDLVTNLLDPVLRKRAGISVGLVQSWEEIVGQRVAAMSRPMKLNWPRRMQDEDAFEPATLEIACEGPAALHIQHESGEIIARVNAFLGFVAVGRIRIVQKPVRRHDAFTRQKPRALDASESRRIEAGVAGIEDEGLRASLERLGRSVLGSRARKTR